MRVFRPRGDRRNRCIEPSGFVFSMVFMATARTRVDTIVLVPIEPDIVKEFVKDTLQSIRAFLGGKHFLILFDDSGKHLAAAAVRMSRSMKTKTKLEQFKPSPVALVDRA